jgi:hypothetical protein
MKTDTALQAKSGTVIKQECLYTHSSNGEESLGRKAKLDAVVWIRCDQAFPMAS